jgi:hypothetical protein
VQRDPIGYKDGMNLYEYVHSNPLGHEDPTGESGCNCQPRFPPLGPCNLTTKGKVVSASCTGHCVGGLGLDVGCNCTKICDAICTVITPNIPILPISTNMFDIYFWKVALNCGDDCSYF